jgi:glycosyltransferase involved in cell wall biosynthesis
VIYEALHHGKPVVAYPHGGAAEILRRHKTGILAAQSRPEALADAMQIALKNEVTEAAIEPPLQSLANFADAYSDVYAAVPTKGLHKVLALRKAAV